MQIVPLGDILYEMSNVVFWENKVDHLHEVLFSEKYLKRSSAEILTQHANV